MLVAVRKFMEKGFTKHELQVLDDLMPETVKKKKLHESLANGLDEDGGEGGDAVDGSESGGEVSLAPFLSNIAALILLVLFSFQLIRYEHGNLCSSTLILYLYEL